MISPRLRTLAVLTALSLVLVGGQRLGFAEDDDASTSRAQVVIDLSAYRPSAIAAMPRLVLPSDVVGRFSAWPNLDEEEAQRFTFEEQEIEGYVTPPEELVQFLYEMLSSAFDQEMLMAEFVDGIGLLLSGRPDAVKSAEEVVTWLLQGAAPSLGVAAVLAAEGDEPRLVAAGSCRLWRGRWTQAFLQYREAGIAADWEIEIAQEITAMHPQVVHLPEGEELYLRYHPGESVSVVEAWVGHLKHTAMPEVDLSVIRNVPESSGYGTITLPQTAGYRAYTAFTIPSDRASKRELRWVGPAGPVRLDLAFDASSPAHVLRQTARPGMASHAQVLRIGAVSAGFEFDRRNDTTDYFVERMQSADPENSYAAYGRSLLRYDGSADAGHAARERILAAERRLTTHQARLRTVTVGESGLRRMLLDGRLAVGKAMDPSVVNELALGDGSVVTGDVSLPLLEDLEASIRVGKSVTGLRSFDVEVAQQAGGMDVVPGSRFAGLFGALRLTREGTGLRLSVTTSVCWATPEGSKVTFTFRPPVGVKTELTEYSTAPNQSVILPILGGGEAVISASAPVTPGGSEVLLGMATHGPEVVLLLGSIAP